MTSSQDSRCVIVGASHAGVTCALRLRRLGWAGSITLVGDEMHVPYHRPPLSKDYLKGEKKAEEIRLNSLASYEKADIELRQGIRVRSIDRGSRRVLLADDTQLDYDKLVLATGARARELSFASRDIAGVCYLRDMNDVDQIRSLSSAGGNAVIVGGGYIGLETAASLRAAGIEVTVLEAMTRILQRVTSRPVSDFFRRVHQEAGVRIVEGAQVSGIVGQDSVEAVSLATGDQIETNLVIVGIGVIPATELAADAGLVVNNGIRVNQFTQTSDADIYAIGDCASFVQDRYAAPLRLESIPNANEMALAAARSMVGQPEPYASVPWFWSDQYDVKLQIAGLADGFDDVIVRGDPSKGREMSVAYLRDKRLLAVDAMNRPRDFVQAKKLIVGNARMNAVTLADPEVAIADATLE